ANKILEVRSNFGYLAMNGRTSHPVGNDSSSGLPYESWTGGLHGWSHKSWCHFMTREVGSGQDGKLKA
ncbi:hypothetical protein HAX54_019353, partial [Datura stramonium]|nr:hypothetical protein [Datura stramonium]